MCLLTGHLSQPNPDGAGADDDKRYRSVLNAALWKNDVLRLKAQVQARALPAGLVTV